MCIRDRVEVAGWNKYGGWRIGIRSFDKKRYYYYAHLRKNRPFAEGLKEGQIVNAGDVIGYLGMTGYSDSENVNGMTIPHPVSYTHLAPTWKRWGLWSPTSR